MFKARLQFSKTGRARFLSHLDTMRVFQRALTRAQIPVEYSNGFNPHMRMSFAFPLPLGVESVCEILDLQLEHPVDGMIEKLNAALPEGFKCLKPLPLFDVNGIARIRYEIVFDKAAGNIFDGRPLPIMKKTKKGVTELDISPFIKNVSCGLSEITAELSAQNPTVNPSHILEALKLVQPGIEILNARRIEMISHESY